MPAKLRRLSGQEVISILKKFGFEIYSRRGSHVKLRRITPEGEKQTLTVVVHKEMEIGTLQAIFRQASRYIPENWLRPYFYRE